MGFACSAPLVLDDDDLRIIVSALKKVRKSQGSVRADRLIDDFEYRLRHPDTHEVDTLANYLRK